MARHASVRTLGVLVAVVTAACGSTSFEVSFGDQRGSISEVATYLVEDDIAGQLGEPLTADCPEVTDPDVGSTFTCTGVTDDGRVIMFDGIVDREDHLDVTSTNLIIAERLGGFETAAAQSVEETVGFAVTVDCGDDFVVLDDASTMTCTVTDPGGAVADLWLRNVDLVAETFDWEILETG